MIHNITIYREVYIQLNISSSCRWNTCRLLDISYELNFTSYLLLNYYNRTNVKKTMTAMTYFSLDRKRQKKGMHLKI